MANPDNAQKSDSAVSGRLASAAQAAGKRGLPPVHLWNPPDCGDIDMRIARDGTWYYLGTPIGRAPLVRLFSTILRRDDARYVLVTPVEKVGIVVDDAPFVAVDFEVTNGALTFVTNVGDEVTAGLEHPLRFTFGPTGEPSPYVHVRGGLEALIDRKSFYRLVELATHHDGWFGLWSAGTFFPLMRSGEVDR